MPGDFFVIVNDEERALEFTEVLGTNQLPVKSLQPVLGTAPGVKGKPFYILDVAQLNPYQRRKLARHIAEKFGLNPDDVHNEMAVNGVPILAEHCSVMLKNPGRWL